MQTNTVYLSAMLISFIGIAIDLGMVLASRDKSPFGYAFVYVFIIMIIQYFTMSPFEKAYMTGVVLITTFIVNYVVSTIAFIMIKYINSNVIYYFAFKIISFIGFVGINFIIKILLKI